MNDEGTVEREGGAEDAQAHGKAAAWAGLGAASREKADAFLDEERELAIEQKKFVRLQMHELAEEGKLRHWSLRIRHISDILKVAFELAVALVFLALAAGIVAAIWAAAHDRGLVIESFDVPSDLASHGVTGPVVAAELLDQLTALQNATSSARPASSFTHDWSNDIRVEIPDTGVSLGEAWRYLRNWLGQDMFLSGEVTESGDTLALTVRLDNQQGQVFAGPRSALDSVVKRAAEAVFRSAQPYRYTVWLGEHGRVAESRALSQELTRSASPTDRAWAYAGLSAIAQNAGQYEESDSNARRSLATDPHMPLGLALLGENANARSHAEAALYWFHKYDAAIEGGDNRAFDPSVAAAQIAFTNARVDSLLGDYAAVVTTLGTLNEVPGDEDLRQLDIDRAQAAALDHDITFARAELAALPPSFFANRLDSLTSVAHAVIAIELTRWSQARASLEAADRQEREGARRFQGSLNFGGLRKNTIEPVLVLADAMLGDFRAAQGLIDGTAPDCYLCLRLRGRIRAAEENPLAAQFWFARAVGQAPSIPFAYADWGEMLLRKGDYGNAIEKFREANLKGPHFADPLEMWGEALMQENRSDLALAKFEEAAKYAPNWGRLHLEWGRALFYVGKRGEAGQQFAIASHLDLNAADTASLARWLAKHV